jgi:beta-lactamase regulating signal transducer with metallopeptidase domain
VHEHIAPAFYYLEVHLLFASLVCCAAWMLTSLPRVTATAKYWIWVATALNFMVPLGGFIDKFGASHISWATPLSMLGDVGVRISRNPSVLGLIALVWVLGAALMLARLAVRLQAERRDVRAASAHSTAALRGSFPVNGIPVRFVGTHQAPAVEGVLRPRIVLPQGIERLLSPPELNAVLIHELTHARRRDNLMRLVFEVGLCGLWFHPLVWMTGARLALYRELSCDESVIERTHGGDLVSALAKLANPQRPLLLRASAASFLSLRLSRLTAAPPRRAGFALHALLALIFGAVLLAGVLGTVAHTACCFVVRI